MSNFPTLPVSTSDPRLSSPEVAAPSLESPALQARRRKLRRIVAWVVGASALLACAGLVLAAVRSHAARVADVETAKAPAQLATVPAQAAQEPAPSTTPAADSNGSEPVAATASSARAPIVAKPVKQRSVVARGNKLKRPSAKSAAARH